MVIEKGQKQGGQLEAVEISKVSSNGGLDVGGSCRDGESG